jgi:hypothetical protein
LADEQNRFNSCARDIEALVQLIRVDRSDDRSARGRKSSAPLAQPCSAMEYGHSGFARGWDMRAWCLRTIILGGLISLEALGSAAAQTTSRPPVGGIGELPDAMIFYVAHGAADACGPRCSEWIAAEGIVEWDTLKRLIAILDRQAPRKLPVVIHDRGGDLKVSTSLGRILRGRGIDTTVGTTEVEACDDKSEADCFALKRQGGPLDARMNLSEPRCDTPCVLILAGGVHRSLPPGTRIMLTGRFIRNRLASNISDEAREGLKARHDELFRLYLREMGVEPELLDIGDQNWESRRETELPPSEWARLGIVTASSP